MTTLEPGDVRSFRFLSNDSEKNMSDQNPTKPGAGLRLLDEFPRQDYAAWQQAAESLLKGAPFQRLRTHTWEGFELEPIYTAEDIEGLPHLREAMPGMGNRVRGNTLDGYRTTSWRISQELVAGLPEAFNTMAREALENGQNELNIPFDATTRAGLDADDPDARGVGRSGVSVSSLDDMRKLLEGIAFDAISTYLRPGGQSLPMAAIFLAAADARGVPFAAIRGCVEGDPLAYLAGEGVLHRDWESACDELAALTRFALGQAPGLQTVAVQGHVYHDGGASSVQELGAVLATGVEYLRALRSRGLSAGEVAPHMRLSVSVGSQYFLEVAKIRALRVLWSRILEAFGVPAEKRRVHIHARTGLWNKTRMDPYVNMLRATTEAFSAVVGGVDSLHVGPFDEVFAEPNAFSRRIARNVHHILAEECDLTKVVDPAGGSWAVERLTHELAEQAWKQFQAIEERGGMRAALGQGYVQEQIAGTLAERRKALAQRREILVGTNQYPAPVAEPAEQPADGSVLREARARALGAHRSVRTGSVVGAALESYRSARPDSAERVRLAIKAAAAGATLAELAGDAARIDRPLQVQAVPVSRAAAEYETLVEAVRALGPRARLRQVNLGPSRRYRLRADWTSAFFRVAGFEVLSDDDFASIGEAVAAVSSDPVRIAVITSDDETYAAQASELAKALRTARPDLRICLAGLPGEREPEWRAAGVDDFVHVRVNNLAFNSALAKSLAE